MIARIWRGVTSEEDAGKYLAYLKKTGVRDCRSTQGNCGVYVLRRVGEGRAEFIFVSLWKSFHAIRRFSGEDIEKAVYYPEDKEFLLELEPTVAHYEVLVHPSESNQGLARFFI